MTKGFKVDKKFFRRWVKALESGKYEQVKNTLKGKTNDGNVGYCCLGVACQLRADSANRARPWGKKGVNSYAQRCEGVKEEYAGSWLLPESEQVKLSTLNDNGSSFKEIAKTIREKYL